MQTTLTSPKGALDWVRTFRGLYDKALAEYGAGRRGKNAWFSKKEKQFLASIGASTQELYDFAEDSADIDWETALLITAARRDYFLVVQHGVPSAKRVCADDLPARDAELGGIAWLPRIVAKAEARLRGEMVDDLMYCCGGDRGFFREHDVHPADFLRVVWSATGDAEAVLGFVRRG